MNPKKINPCGKRRPVNKPYEVWVNKRQGWTWKVLKKYQSPENECTNEWARWYCHVTSPHNEKGEYGDVLVRSIKKYAQRFYWEEGL